MKIILLKYFLYLNAIKILKLKLLKKNAIYWPAERKKRSSVEKARLCTPPLWWSKVVRHVPFWTFQMQMRLLAPIHPPDADAMVCARDTHRLSRSVEIYRRNHQLISRFFTELYADKCKMQWIQGAVMITALKLHISYRDDKEQSLFPEWNYTCSQPEVKQEIEQRCPGDRPTLSTGRPPQSSHALVHG